MKRPLATIPAFLAPVLFIAPRALAHDPAPHAATWGAAVPGPQIAQPSGFSPLPPNGAQTTQQYPAAMPPVAIHDPTHSYVPHRHHLIIGATAAPFLTFDVHNGWKPYIGVSLLPELRYAFSIDEVADTPRIFTALRWTAFSTSVPFQKNVAAEPVSELELMAAIGVSFRISRSLETRDRMTTSVGWLSVGIGYGNLKSRTGELITGPSLLLSLDTDGLSFNIGGSR